MIASPPFPHADKGGSWQIRFYQDIAVLRALEAIASGLNRILLTLADQAFNDFTGFAAFEDNALARIEPDALRKKGRVPANASVFLTIFQTFMSRPVLDGKPSPWFGHYPPDFFDIVVVDECHRGGANNESTWRGILDHFAPAVQLGLTATPRRSENDGELGNTWLRAFQDNEKTIPTILTTSQKLSTGVDARNVRNIVLLRPVNSMIEFTQIIGRGTRLYDGKDYFTILDFVKAHHHFSDPEWDGEPIEPDAQAAAGRSTGNDGTIVAPPPPEPGTGPQPPRPRLKIKLGDGADELPAVHRTALRPAAGVREG